jgi:hypothetical protein
MNSVVVCETPRLYKGLGRDVEYLYVYDLVEWGSAYKGLAGEHYTVELQGSSKIDDV